MTRYAKLAGRKPQFSKSSAQEARQQREGSEARSEASDHAGPSRSATGSPNSTLHEEEGAQNDKRAESVGAREDAHTTSTGAEGEDDPSKLLKRVKLLRLKAKKAKTTEKRRELEQKMRELERKVHLLNGQRGQKSKMGTDKGTEGAWRPDQQSQLVRTTASQGITNPWKAMEAERRAKAEERSSVRREKRIAEREASQRCYACRQIGHSAKQCPQASAATAEATARQTDGLVSADHPLVCCYRCGSTEHSLAKCRRPTPRTGPELPFAHCFICQQRGHLASKCEQNQGRGIYPLGGSCMLCQSVEHLAKDCPLNEAQRSGGSTAASNAAIGLADIDGERRGADEDDFHALSRKRIRLDGKETKATDKRAKVSSTHQAPKRVNVVTF